MSFTPPDFSQILANEQTMNSRLTILRSNLRTGLTNAGISYAETDTISQLIDRYEILPIFQTISMSIPTQQESLEHCIRCPI